MEEKLKRLALIAKALVAALPALVFLLTSIVNALTDAGIAVPAWLAAAVAAVTAFAVWAVPNGYSADPETSTPGPGNHAPEYRLDHPNRPPDLPLT